MKKQFFQLLVRIVANAAGIFVAAHVLDKINVNGGLLDLFVAATILSLLNAVIRPIVVIFSLPAYVVTLGLFSVVVNAFMLYLVDFLYGSFDVGGLFAPIVAGIIIGLVNYIVTRIFDLAKPKESGSNA